MKEPKIRYYLKPSHKDPTRRNKPELVMAEVNYRYKELTRSGKMRHKPMRYSLGHTILPSKFGLASTNFKQDSEVFKTSQRSNRTIANEINKFETALTAAFRHFDSQPIPTPTELKLFISNYLNPNRITHATSLIQFLKEQVKLFETNKHKQTKKGKVEDTVKSYRSLLRHLENYELATKHFLAIENFDENTYDHLWDVLDDIRRGIIEVDNPNQSRKSTTCEYGYLVNAISKHQSTLFTVLTIASKKGIQCKLNLNDRDIILPRKESQKSYTLTEDEILLISQHDFSYDEKLVEAQKYIVIASCTGMRIQSMNEAADKSIEVYNKGDLIFKYIRSYQQKTDTRCCVPLLPLALNFIESDTFPTFSSGINTHIKRLLKELKIDREIPITLITYREGTINKTEPLHTIASSHDFRKTMYTHFKSTGLEEKDVQQITHPKGNKSSMDYVYDNPDELKRAERFVKKLKDQPYNESKIYKLD